MPCACVARHHANIRVPLQVGRPGFVIRKQLRGRLACLQSSRNNSLNSFETHTPVLPPRLP
eukprot:COSAG01_NODE_42134_length_443_cov_0.950581_1_plen_60_part_10